MGWTCGRWECAGGLDKWAGNVEGGSSPGGSRASGVVQVEGCAGCAVQVDEGGAATGWKCS